MSVWFTMRLPGSAQSVSRVSTCAPLPRWPARRSRRRLAARGCQLDNHTAADSGSAATLGRAQLSVRRELVCFYSKVPFTEAVLGFGMDVQHGARYENGTRHVKGITTELELLSRDSFSSGVRCGVWRTAGKAEDFNQWLPVLLDADHTARAMPLVRAGLMAIAGHPPQRPFDPLVALTVLPKLLNQMTVRLMTCDDNTSLHASEKAESAMQ